MNKHKHMESSSATLTDALPPTTTTKHGSLTLHPLPLQSPLQSNANQQHQQLASNFGRIVTGIELESLESSLEPSLESRLKQLLFKHSILVFRGGASVSPRTQLALTRVFDASAPGFYGHDNNNNNNNNFNKKSVLHPDLKTIPAVPQVQLIGNGFVEEHEGLANVNLVHPHHRTFHRDVVSEDDEERGYTRFYRWHIDAALYDLSPPVATTLHAIKVPKDKWQTVRYDDGTGDELKVPLGATAFISGAQAFSILPPHHKSLAVRTRVTYAPHPYVWMSPAKSLPTGLGLYSDSLELPLDALPPFTEEKMKTLPLCWKNPETGELHLQVHPSAIYKLTIDPSPSPKEGDLYPEGATLTSLPEIRALIYSLQRPAIAPQYVYAHDWEEGDFVVFHNRGVLHSITGAFRKDQVRMFHQCNLASGSDPEGPDQEDVERFC
ncbi:Clavaminate synthase-like protein [Rhizoclosmatium globosum]|uniref:Clavaminate synthase-like protein n=1 Tax=Rhizoclosmatium globosum TaxID=329046 RepID=A0A1Y2B5B8_9FUNG|nr:Clavaminate synthase-like protein [Rhizoclosmatium globosum]|eukprot:ORY29934.1 Clavaminate synthase-like protein [Rhizoclosmatium globosum]